MTEPNKVLQLISHVFKELSQGLNERYTYHSLFHTSMVMRDASFIGYKLNLSLSDSLLLKTAICLHDSGFVISHENHEIRGCQKAQEMLPEYGFTEKEIERVCGMIMATKIPQSPTNLLEKIICDADLFYLGTNYYFEVASTFKKELQALGVLKTEEQWKNIQVSFLEGHRYHTNVAKNMLENVKQKNLEILKNSK